MHIAITEKSNSEAEDGEGHFNKRTYQGLVIEEAEKEKSSKGREPACSHGAYVLEV